MTDTRGVSLCFILFLCHLFYTVSLNRRRLLKLLILSSIFLLTSSVTYGAVINLINPGTDNRISTITGLNIGGSFYDATFHHGVRYADVPIPNLTFGAGNGDFSLSLPAAAAIGAAVGTIANAVSPTTSAFIPTFTFLGNIHFSFAQELPPDNYSDWDASDIGTFAFSATSVTLASQDAWVTFEDAAITAVPEPSSFGLVAMGAVCFGLGSQYRRRKRAKLSQ